MDIDLDFAELGKMSIDTSVSGTVSVTYDGKKAKAGFTGSFNYRRKKYHIKANLGVKNEAIAKLGDTVAKEIKNTFIDVFADAEEWAKFAKSGVMKGVESTEQAAKVLSNTFKKTSKDSAKALKAAGHTMNDIGNSLKSVYKLDSKAM